MKIIVFLIMVSLLVAVGFLIAFLWAVRDGQYDDDYTPSLRLLVDDDMFVRDNNDEEHNLKQDEKIDNVEYTRNF